MVDKLFDSLRYLLEGACRGRVRPFGYEGLAVVAVGDDCRLKGNPSQKRYPQLLRGLLPSADFEKIDFLAAVGAFEPAHVFDDANHRDMEQAAEADRFSGIEQRDFLGSGNDNGSIHFTPGSSYDHASNGNHSNIHWDLVMIQTPKYGGGKIYFDDVLIRDNGLFVLDALKPLNP